VGTLTAPEIREWSLTPQERADSRDSRVRAFERQWADWTEIAKVCIDVERDKDYLLLGYPTWNAWIMAAAPCSRSYLYLVVGRYKELSVDIPEEELAQIPLGSAGVLKKLPSKIRQKQEVRESAKQRPEKFVADLQVMEPLQHLEAKIRKEVFFTASQWEIVAAKFEAYLLTDEHGTLADFIEFLCSEQ
jgi:hypothetical protein